MEEHMGYLIAAIVSFCLAGCSLIACVIIFFKLKVADAIRFLSGRPTREPRSKASARVKAAPLFRRGANRTTATAKGATAKGDDATTSSDAVPVGGGDDRSTSAVSDQAEGVPASEQPTQVVGNAPDSEDPTVVGAVPSENPTVVGAAPSENPTVVSAPVSEAPTVVVPPESESPTVISAPASEAPTVVTAFDGEEPAEAASQADEDEGGKADGTAFAPQEASIERDEARAGVAQQSEPSFRFTLRHNQVVVHTDEVID